MELALRVEGERVLVPVRAQPRGGRSEVCGVASETGALKIRLAAPPVDGAANEELLRFLGREVLRVAPSSLRLVKGERGRDKWVEVRGLSAEEVRARLLGG